jgi:hypothetical protein
LVLACVHSSHTHTHTQPSQYGDAWAR